MSKISATIRVIYYLLLNGGKVNPKDTEAVNIRMQLPITISISCANGTIQKLLEMAAKEEEADPSTVKATMRKFEWCYPGIPAPNVKPIGISHKRVVKAKPIKKSNFTGVFRRADSGSTS